jgi:MFS family permease
VTPPPIARLPAPSQTPSLAPLYLVNFIGALGFGLVLPFLVFLVTRWGGNALVYGLLGATYSLFQLIGAPVLGRWSDHLGRRRVLLLSQIGTLISWIIFLIAFALPEKVLLAPGAGVFGGVLLTLPLMTLFIARALDGATGGNVSVANAYLADLTTAEERSAKFGRMAVASNLGYILGPAIAGLLAATRYGELLPILGAIAVSTFATWLIAARLVDVRPCSLDSDPEPGGALDVLGQEHKPCLRLAVTEKLSFADILRLPGIALLMAIIFLVMLGFNFFYVAFPVYASGALAWSVTEIGAFFAIMSVLMVAVQGPVLSRLSQRFSAATLTVVGSLVLAAAFALFAGIETWVIYLGVALMAFGNGLMWPSLTAILADTAGEIHQGAVQGLAGSAGAFASILGLLSGGVLFGVIGGRIFFLSAIVIFGCFVLALRLPGKTTPRLQT